MIFVDLALAQVAALGATCGIFIGYALHSHQAYLISLGFAGVGALLLASTRTRSRSVPHEAIIGIIYVMAAAAAIIVLSRAPEGGEEIKSLLVGHLLFVSSGEVAYVACVYGLVGIALFFLHPRLVQISTAGSEMPKEQKSVWIYDLIFYGLFALVVTSSVELGGVLLVFALLVVPSVSAAFLADSTRARLITSWLIGAFTSAFGLWVSYQADLPSGASVVCAFIVPLVLAALVGSRRRLKA